MAEQPYVARLPDGRYFAVELPEGSSERDPLTGELILHPSAIRLLDRLRVLLTPLPVKTTKNRLALLREALGLSHNEMAAQLGIASADIEDWESGLRAPTSDQLAALERLRQRATRAGVLVSQEVLAS